MKFNYSQKPAIPYNINFFLHFRCDNVIYPEELPTASIIICFYNEHFTTLLRSIYSILDRTPSQYLKEILLVDDFSDVEELQKYLKEHIDLHLADKVKLYRTERREGLIRARIFGSRRAEGEVGSYGQFKNLQFQRNELLYYIHVKILQLKALEKIK